MKCYYEEYRIKNGKLPIEWQSQKTLDDLEIFLQSNWEQRSAFYEDGEVSSKQQFLKFESHSNVRTSKYIGTIAFNGGQITIFPKMFKEDKDDYDTDNLTVPHLMKNLVKWIEYCNKFEYPYLNLTTELDDITDLRELFITLYIRYVDAALNRALFYRYEDKTEDLSSIKGKFNIKDYITRKIPNGMADKFECTYSNFEYDNILNRIIKYTSKLLINQTSVENQKRIRHILMKLNEVSDVKCVPYDCDRVRLSKLQSHYSIILSMSKMFLLNQTATFNMDNNESFCFLFPSDLLFEGFIGGFIQNMLEGQAKVKLQASDMKLFDNLVYENVSYGSAFTMRHDILVETKEKLFILDTKYKQLSNFDPNNMRQFIDSVSQVDLYQLFSYAARRGVNDVYLLYPLFRFEDIKSEVVLETKANVQIDGVSAEYPINVYIVRLPFIFEENEEETFNKLRITLEKIFN